MALPEDAYESRRRVNAIHYALSHSISVPAGRLTKRQRRALPVERPPITPEYLDAKQLAVALNGLCPNH